MKTEKIITLLVVGAIILVPALLKAHCEIPCGIYDDKLRYDLLKEHITTIEKSMTKINELSAEGEKNYNQLVRWVTNKESHADKFMEIVTQYFLTQRIKPVGADTPEKYAVYQTHLEYFHQMLIYAMKAKQTTDMAHIVKLRELVENSEKLYFEKDAH